MYLASALIAFCSGVSAGSFFVFGFFVLEEENADLMSDIVDVTVDVDRMDMASFSTLVLGRLEELMASFSTLVLGRLEELMAGEL
jgi:hypothetical protein